MANKNTNNNWPLTERVELLFSGNMVALGAGTLVAIALAALHVRFVGLSLIIGWLAFGAILTLSRLALHITYQQRPKTFSDRGWLQLFLAGVFLSGLFWGAAGTLMFPSQTPVHVMFTAFALAGLCAGAVTVYSAVPLAFLLFALPTLAPFVARLIIADNPDYQIMALMTAVFFFALSFAARGAYRTLNDIIALRLANAELEHQATHDGLVDLLNHREFRRRLDRVLAQDKRLRRGCGLIFVDLDAFKRVNDTAGHLVGDELLRRIGEVLRQPDTNPALAARIGGDEFALLIYPVTQHRATEIGEWLREAISNCQVVFEGREHRVHASVGIAFAEDGNFNAADILTAADTACYEAKASGRNRVKVNVLREPTVEDQPLRQRA